MAGPVVVLIRRTHDARSSREILEMAAALAVFALPVTLLCLAPPDTLLATTDADVADLLDSLPGYGTVSLVAQAAAAQQGFRALPQDDVRTLLATAESVIGD